MRLSRDEVVDARDAGDDDGEGDAGTARGGGSFRAGERMRERGDVPGNEGFTGDGSGDGSGSGEGGSGNSDQTKAQGPGMRIQRGGRNPSAEKGFESQSQREASPPQPLRRR